MPTPEEESLLKRHLSIDGDGNVLGDDNTVKITKQSAGDYAVQIGVQNITIYQQAPEGAQASNVADHATASQQKLLIVWGDVPFAPESHPPSNPVLLINDWLRIYREKVPPLSWALCQLPPLPILSLDPTPRMENAFAANKIRLSVINSRRDVPASGVHNLFKLGGDLQNREGLFLSWDDVRNAPNLPDKAYILDEVRRIVKGGVVLLLCPNPSRAFKRFWVELLAPVLQFAGAHLVLGPLNYPWPEPLQPIPYGKGTDFPKIDDVLNSIVPVMPSEAEASRPFDKLKAGSFDFAQDDCLGNVMPGEVEASDTASLSYWRNLLNNALDDVQLDTFCLDKFPKVYDKFSRGMRKDEKLNLLLDHCRRLPNHPQPLATACRNSGIQT